MKVDYKSKITDLDNSHVEIAMTMMKEIVYDNGMVDRFNPESKRTYPDKHIFNIAVTAGNYFNAHPEFLTNEDIENICCGEQTEVFEKYGIYPEFEPLNIALNDFFN